MGGGGGIGIQTRDASSATRLYVCTLILTFWLKFVYFIYSNLPFLCNYMWNLLSDFFFQSKSYAIFVSVLEHAELSKCHKNRNGHKERSTSFQQNNLVNMICTCSWQIWWDSLVQWVNTVSSSTYSHWRTPTLRSLSLSLSLSLARAVRGGASCARSSVLWVWVPILFFLTQSWTCWHFPALTADALTVRGFSSLRLTKEISIRHAETRALFQRTEPKRIRIRQQEDLKHSPTGCSSRFPWCWNDLIWSDLISVRIIIICTGRFR